MTRASREARPGSSKVRTIGGEPTDLRQILVTHCHYYHSGSLAEIKRQSRAPAVMHPADAEMVRSGKAKRPMTRTPGLRNALICWLFIRKAPGMIEPVQIEHEVQDGAVLPGGLQAIHVPGHCAGQLAFLWPEHGGVLIAAAASNALGLAMSPIHEDLAEGKRSLSKLASLEFEVACFGHGKPIMSDAGARFRKRWPAVRRSAPQVS